MDTHETLKTYLADQELSLLLEAAASEGEPLRVKAGDATYAVHVARVADQLWADYDPERVRAALREYGGSWSDLDANELKSAMYRAREAGSRPIDHS